jgi:hypothetical protein
LLHDIANQPPPSLYEWIGIIHELDDFASKEPPHLYDWFGTSENLDPPPSVYDWFGISEDEYYELPLSKVVNITECSLLSP